MDLRIHIEYDILLFFSGAILGWCMEVLCKLVQFHRFINRGFLLGPYCPIYGFGAVLLTELLLPFSAYPVAVFFLGMLICGALEYLTSYAMEKLFHARWWDYSQRRFNLNGRICAGTLIPFGLLGMSMVYLIQPFLFRQFAKLEADVLTFICVGMLVLFLTDLLISVLTLVKIRSKADAIEGDSTETITAAVREALARQSVLARRLLHAFPDVRIYSGRLLSALQEKRRKMREEMRAAREAARQAVLESEERTKAEIRRLSEEQKQLKNRMHMK